MMTRSDPELQSAVVFGFKILSRRACAKVLSTSSQVKLLSKNVDYVNIQVSVFNIFHVFVVWTGEVDATCHTD